MEHTALFESSGPLPCRPNEGREGRESPAGSYESPTGTPRFWRLEPESIKGFEIPAADGSSGGSSGRGGGGGGGGGGLATAGPGSRQAHGPLRCAYPLQPLGRPLSRHSSLTEALQHVVIEQRAQQQQQQQQQQWSPKLSVKTTRTGGRHSRAGSGGQRKRCASSMSLHIVSKAPGRGAGGTAGAAGQRPETPAALQHSVSMEIPKSLRRAATCPSQLDVDAELIAAALRELHHSPGSAAEDLTTPHYVSSASTSWRDPPMAAATGTSAGAAVALSSPPATPAQAARRLFYAQADASQEHAQVEVLKAALRKERERVAWLESALERALLDRERAACRRLPPSGTPHAGEAGTVPSAFSTGTVPSTFAWHGMEAGEGGSGETPGLGVALSGVLEESSREVSGLASRELEGPPCAF